MARYFFDIHNGDEFFRDPEGIECSDAGSIRTEAMRTLPEIARHTILARKADVQALTILVRNQDQRTVYAATLTFSGLWVDEPLGS
ncbi:hypothetical protein [Methylobacterium sp. Leaf125]|uniref:DUF6894 family protein n=1 Tax=Methylobacterium sp. Leaf125 TaxID=1736265 RepID=UPI0009E7A985|nr:hypothetical protein [Methylobacterium sp. Leaf125]